MAGGGGGGRNLEETPTWAVAGVCFVLLFISIIIEHAIHLLGKWLEKLHKRALFEAVEKIKSELMLLGFISLMLMVGQDTISNICIPENVGGSWHPCKKPMVVSGAGGYNNGINVSSGRGRVLAGGGSEDKCAAKNKVPLISIEGLHQLHKFIFVLALTHVIYCITTMALGRLKMRIWKSWEERAKTAEYQFAHGPERFRFTRETSFGRRHLNFWSKSPILIWIVSFFRQFFLRSVSQVDYMTLRHGFIMAHLSPQSSANFDFRQYILRSLENDFTVVVEISPTIWFFAVLFLLFYTNGWHSFLWIPFIPLVIILCVGTKLQVIITTMALEIMGRGDVVRGVPTVHLTDDHFWFHRPRLLLYLIHFVLFQNAFQIGFVAWTWCEYGFPSCFHHQISGIIIRVVTGVLIQILCSYVTLPLYALVTQMGTKMKPTIFNERVATALRKWHHQAKKNLRGDPNQVRPFGNATPRTVSRSGMPVHGRGKERIQVLIGEGELEGFEFRNQLEQKPPPPQLHTRQEPVNEIHAVK